MIGFSKYLDATWYYNTGFLLKITPAFCAGVIANNIFSFLT